MKPKSIRRTGSDVARAALVVAAGVMVLLFLISLLGWFSRPYRGLWRDRSELGELAREVQAERRERKQLLGEIARMKTREGLLMEARRLGYLAPGERMLRYVEPENWPRTERRPQPPSRLSQMKEKLHRLLDQRDEARLKQRRAEPTGD
jgi:hypothetical protein